MSKPAIVKFIDGPHTGSVEASQGDASDIFRRGAAMMAVDLYRKYSVTPPPDGVGWWFVCATGIGANNGPHYYKIVSGKTVNDRLEITCEYGGTEHPTDHSHDDE